MGTEHSIRLGSGVDPDVGVLLSGMGARNIEGASDWELPDSRCYEVMSTLQEREIDFRLLHNFSTGDRTWSETAPAYLCIVPEREAPKSLESRPVLLEPTEGVSVLGNQKFVDLISRLAPDLTWRSGRKDGLRQLSHAPKLPDPVEIVEIYEKDRGQTGMWLIAHDGQEFLTDRNIEIIRDAGGAWSDEYQFKNEKFPVLPTLVFSGKVVDTLIQNDVRFTAPPIYLLKRPRTSGF